MAEEKTEALTRFFLYKRVYFCYSLVGGVDLGGYRSVL